MLKILVLGFIVFGLARVIIRFRDKTIGFREFVFWILVWLVSMAFIFVPTISNYFATELGVGRGVDAAFFVAFMIMFYAIFRLYVNIDKLDKDITNLSVNISKELHKLNRTKK
jgi:hypothetical protein